MAYPDRLAFPDPVGSALRNRSTVADRSQRRNTMADSAVTLSKIDRLLDEVEHGGKSITERLFPLNDLDTADMETAEKFLSDPEQYPDGSTLSDQLEELNEARVQRDWSSPHRSGVGAQTPWRTHDQRVLNHHMALSSQFDESTWDPFLGNLSRDE